MPFLGQNPGVMAASGSESLKKLWANLDPLERALPLRPLRVLSVGPRSSGIWTKVLWVLPLRMLDRGCHDRSSVRCQAALLKASRGSEQIGRQKRRKAEDREGRGQREEVAGPGFFQAWQLCLIFPLSFPLSCQLFSCPSPPKQILPAHVPLPRAVYPPHTVLLSVAGTRIAFSTLATLHSPQLLFCREQGIGSHSPASSLTCAQGTTGNPFI